MKAADTSVTVAAFGQWHRLHEPARATLDEGVSIPAHVLLETYAVLTGFPPPHRASPAIVRTWLDGRFAVILPAPSTADHQALSGRLADAGRAGGSVYDALVGLTAKASGVTLVTADERAAVIYELLEVDTQLLVS